MSITANATSAAATPKELGEKVQAFVGMAKAMSADGLSFTEAGELAAQLLRLTMAAVDSIPADGPAKKAFVLDAIGLLYDAVVDRLVPLPMYPLWLLVRSPVRSLVIAVASGAVESLLPIVRAAA